MLASVLRTIRTQHTYLCRLASSCVGATTTGGWQLAGSRQGFFLCRAFVAIEANSLSGCLRLLVTSTGRASTCLWQHLVSCRNSNGDVYGNHSMQCMLQLPGCTSSQPWCQLPHFKLCRPAPWATLVRRLIPLNRVWV